MKFATPLTLLACSLAVAAIPTEQGMDEASNNVASAFAATVYRFLTRESDSSSDEPHMLGEPTYFVVEST